MLRHGGGLDAATMVADERFGAGGADVDTEEEGHWLRVPGVRGGFASPQPSPEERGGPDKAFCVRLEMTE